MEKSNGLHDRLDAVGRLLEERNYWRSLAERQGYVLAQLLELVREIDAALPPMGGALSPDGVTLCLRCKAPTTPEQRIGSFCRSCKETIQRRREAVPS